MMARLLKNREILLVVAIAVLLALIALRFPAFVAPSNLARVYGDTSILVILALGQMAVILTRCIDLSMAANLALCGMVAAMLNQRLSRPADTAHPCCRHGAGGFPGAINGALV